MFKSLIVIVSLVGASSAHALMVEKNCKQEGLTVEGMTYYYSTGTTICDYGEGEKSYQNNKKFPNNCIANWWLPNKKRGPGICSKPDKNDCSISCTEEG